MLSVCFLDASVAIDRRLKLTSEAVVWLSIGQSGSGIAAIARLTGCVGKAPLGLTGQLTSFDRLVSVLSRQCLENLKGHVDGVAGEDGFLWSIDALIQDLSVAGNLGGRVIQLDPSIASLFFFKSRVFGPGKGEKRE
jgi:hypothetical protein